jgi:hypothetical protein
MFFSTANDVDSQIRNARNGCTIATLAHARALIGALSEAERRKEHWLSARGVTCEAADHAWPDEDRVAQLIRARGQGVDSGTGGLVKTSMTAT